VSMLNTCDPDAIHSSVVFAASEVFPLIHLLPVLQLQILPQDSSSKYKRQGLSSHWLYRGHRRGCHYPLDEA
ncbi:hypothetical protein NDU88_007546, partial [Pleurodeles waltl]